MNARTRLHQHGQATSGFSYAEEWQMNGRPLERFKMLRSYPWTYRWLDIQQPNGLGQPLTGEEITSFKTARVA